MSSTLQGSYYHWRNRYLLMRHGHSQANEQGLIISSPERGLDAFGLSETGERQLDEVVKNWVWPTPTRIVHSDFLRTTETARRVADALGVPIEKDERLRERYFGEFEGQKAALYEGVWVLDDRNAEHAAHGVEPVARVAARMQAVIEAWEARVSGETILLVSHGDPLQILLTAIAGKPLTGHRDQTPLEPASITLVDKSA
ncbi:histidine phosphatase family protein [Halomonas sp. GD1P12]|uniref:histidine phosphatase family protein n=1 Tax=Halomonas sp. GD1P12 TaxID=2982691 RepID=UPI0021E4EB78|nr:histidine phosphatase family protein [Halomonas sp. GD1P12]UYF99736.1 histidine phosphatase family protein [Halomonas sp. GD1P12]